VFTLVSLVVALLGVFIAPVFGIRWCRCFRKA